VRELKAHSKARTPLTVMAKKRPSGRFGERPEFSASAWDIASIAADSQPALTGSELAPAVAPTPPPSSVHDVAAKSAEHVF
jgi:hypothetical protein